MISLRIGSIFIKLFFCFDLRVVALNRRLNILELLRKVLCNRVCVSLYIRERGLSRACIYFHAKRIGRSFHCNFGSFGSFRNGRSFNRNFGSFGSFRNGRSFNRNFGSFGSFRNDRSFNCDFGSLGSFRNDRSFNRNFGSSCSFNGNFRRLCCRSHGAFKEIIRTSTVNSHLRDKFLALNVFGVSLIVFECRGIGKACIKNYIIIR